MPAQSANGSQKDLSSSTNPTSPGTNASANINIPKANAISASNRGNENIQGPINTDSNSKNPVASATKPNQSAGNEAVQKPLASPTPSDQQDGNNSSFTNTNSSIVDILVKNNQLDPETAKEVKLAQIQSGQKEEEILKNKNLVSENEIIKAKAALYNIEFVDLKKNPVSPEALSVVPQQVARRFRVFPVAIDTAKNQLSLAMADPLDLTTIEFIEQKTNLRVHPLAADPNMIDEYLATAYTSSLAKEVTAALREVSADRTPVKTLDTSRTGVIRDEKVAEIVTHILEFAVKARASDVHIEPQERLTRVRYRIDGILQEKLTTPRELHDALVSRIKILSGMKIDEKRVPQDGRFNFRAGDTEVDLRVSTLPVVWGEKVVMRILKKSGGIPDLPDLGLRGNALKNLQEAILRPHGIIIICGPTGSGKTTTLYSIIQRLNTPKVNIITLEDPIEYRIPGVNQVQINPGAGLTFASGLRSFLRQDPNIILVGEIRDQETADLAIQAALTGHLVFSTLHTNDAAGALPRLLDMGAEPFLLASSITTVVAQRVVRKIHNDCKKQIEPDPKGLEEMKQVLGNLMPAQNQAKFYKGEGDKECNNTGYYGRVGIFEVMSISEKISRLILEHSAASEIEKTAKEDGMITMKQDGYLKVLEGTTTLEEVLRVAQE